MPKQGYQWNRIYVRQKNLIKEKKIESLFVHVQCICPMHEVADILDHPYPPTTNFTFLLVDRSTNVYVEIINLTLCN